MGSKRYAGEEVKMHEAEYEITLYDGKLIQSANHLRKALELRDWKEVERVVEDMDWFTKKYMPRRRRRERQKSKNVA